MDKKEEYRRICKDLKQAIEDDNTNLALHLTAKLENFFFEHLGGEKTDEQPTEKKEETRLRHVIELIEYERGWGKHTLQKRYFITKDEALGHARLYNQKYNSKSIIPSYYITAQYAGEENVPVSTKLHHVGDLSR